MTKQFMAAARVLLVLTVLLGVGYPLVMTGLAQAVPHEAHGSMLTRHGRQVGSSLIGQQARGPEWFHARPSVPGYSGQASGGSNWGPSSPELAAEITKREATLVAANPRSATRAVPSDALSAGASGLEPYISPDYAAWQAPRVAAARGLPLAQVNQLIHAHTTHGELGFLAADRVNVTTLNVALADARH